MEEQPRSSKAHVQDAFVAFLGQDGWEIVETAQTTPRWSRPDLVARRDGVELVVEVTGLPDGDPADVSTEARHHAAGALLTGLLARDEYPDSRTGLVFPDEPTYRDLLRRLRQPLEQLGLSVWFVAEDGRVARWLAAPLLGTAAALATARGAGATPLEPGEPTTDGADDADDEPSRFVAALEEGARCHESLLGYDPTGLAEMVADPDPVAASKRLLNTTSVSEGFVTLWEHGRLDETIEWYVLAHAGLFTDQERQVAYERLKEYEVPIDLWLRGRLGRRLP